MKFFAMVCVALACVTSQSFGADDNVTIPKSRLEELERKAAELDRLKAQTSAPPAAPVASRPTQSPSAPAAPAVVPAPRQKPSEVVALPPLKDGEIVSAEELATHYFANPVAAEARYGKKRLQVQGEIVAFENAAFRRDYEILLQTGERGVRVVCSFTTNPDWRSVYSVNSGSELVATLQDYSRLQLGRVGDRVIITGTCKGVKGLNVRLVSCEIKTQP
jgi:hypothetical protein